jgi:hypothetical protein
MGILNIDFSFADTTVINSEQRVMMVVHRINNIYNEKKSSKSVKERKEERRDIYID